MTLFPIWRVKAHGESAAFSRKRWLWPILAVALVLGGAGVGQAQDEIVIVALGDSLTAGFQLPPEQSFPAQLEKALKDKGHNVRVLNAGVSGDTAAAGLKRLDWAVPAEADAVIVELGANDALRGLNPLQTKSALDTLLSKLKAKGLPVLLAGMMAPRNLGADYAESFDPIYAELARSHDALLYPFFLDGVAADPKLNLADGLHPNGEGVARIVANMLPKVEELIARAKKTQG
jgi:acyl-CoA thioesterase-1